MDSFYDTENNIYFFTKEEIKEYVIDDIYSRLGKEYGVESESWPWSAYLIWFVDHYNEEFEIVKQ